MTGHQPVRVAVASVPFPASLDAAVRSAVDAVRAAADQGARLLCLPEACIPGHRLGPLPVLDYRQSELDAAVAEVGEAAGEAGVVTILGTERVTRYGRLLLATVLNGPGAPTGHQVKTQLAPEEDAHYVPGQGRQVFRAGEVTFGIAICHEAFRHPETVRSAVLAGAQIVFHPHFTATDGGPPLTRWGDADNPYYESAVRCRAIENTVVMASANYAVPDQASASAIVDHNGLLLGHVPYGRPGTVVAAADLSQANGSMARRYSPERNRLAPDGVRD
jgi:predicted amidohydrolase